MSATRPTSADAALEWDLASAPMPGENVIGDGAFVEFAHEHVVAAAIDGVGHGAAAAAAARVAMRSLQRAATHDLGTMVRDCHVALTRTRGAVLSLARIDYREQTLTWVGIGNVEGRLVRAGDRLRPAESLLLHGGVVGHALPRLTPQTTSVARGDLLIFATDGIRREFADSLVPSGSCRDIAERILRDYALGSDDALVLVARYLGRA